MLVLEFCFIASFLSICVYVSWLVLAKLGETPAITFADDFPLMGKAGVEVRASNANFREEKSSLSITHQKRKPTLERGISNENRSCPMQGSGRSGMSILRN